VNEWRVVATDDVTVQEILPGPTTDWVTPQGIAFVDVRTVGNFTYSHADVVVIDAPFGGN